ncbi:hypothetical protein PoB_004059400 [Plakobranchus ocellatus]|uniref:Uncharacterized protein n=1 Tax=Plakobranchus ocellatus TaxID=259542 RepID=A0AAV4B244_9GAST|nr:hypothetical protein PoB_004059400 [Plakobranchus ocellatus]
MDTSVTCIIFKNLNKKNNALEIFILKFVILILWGGVGGTLACESALRSLGTLLLRVRAPPLAPRPDGGPYSLRSPCCGLAKYKNPILEKRRKRSSTREGRRHTDEEEEGEGGVQTKGEEKEKESRWSEKRRIEEERRRRSRR